MYEFSAKVHRKIRSYPSRLKKSLWQTLLDKYPHLMAKAVREMAETGRGTEACLSEGALPMRVHFYSPVPDIKELESRGIWSKKSKMAGIDIGVDRQLQLVNELGTAFGQECSWPKHQTANSIDFFTHNNSFSYGCAAALHTMIRKFKPKKIVEIGSGNSSKVIAAALKRNESETGIPAHYRIVDPYPNPYVFELGANQVDSKRVELCNPEDFRNLAENDILFIDSSHVVKPGSDVNFLILDVLPNLNPGVVVHFHDISLPYEYPKAYATSPTFRVFWNEAYLLQAFLSGNQDFEVLLMMNLVQEEHMDVFQKAFPHFSLSDNWANSGSFWIRRKP